MCALDNILSCSSLVAQCVHWITYLAAAHWFQYNKREDPVPEDEYERHKTNINFRRTIRDASKVGLCSSVIGHLAMEEFLVFESFAE